MSKKTRIRRGEIYLADLNCMDEFGCVQRGFRPVIVYSNDTNNTFCDTVQIIPVSGSLKKLCVHVEIEGCGLDKKSMAYAEQIRTINKRSLASRIGKLTQEYMYQLDDAVDIQLGRKRPVKVNKEVA